MYMTLIYRKPYKRCDYSKIFSLSFAMLYPVTVRLTVGIDRLIFNCFIDGALWWCYVSVIHSHNVQLLFFLYEQTLHYTLLIMHNRMGWMSFGDISDEHVA